MAGDPLSLSETVRVSVEGKNNHLYLSAASAWEIAMLQQLKRLELPDVPQRFIGEALQQLSVLPIPIGFTTAFLRQRPVSENNNSIIQILCYCN